MQSEWNALQLAQMRMAHQSEKEKAQRKSKAGAAPEEETAKKVRSRVVKPVSRSGGGAGGSAAPAAVSSRMIESGDVEHRAEWDEV